MVLQHPYLQKALFQAWVWQLVCRILSRQRSMQFKKKLLSFCTLDGHVGQRASDITRDFTFSKCKGIWTVWPRSGKYNGCSGIIAMAGQNSCVTVYLKPPFAYKEPQSKLKKGKIGWPKRDGNFSINTPLLNSAVHFTTTDDDSSDAFKAYTKSLEPSKSPKQLSVSCLAASKLWTSARVTHWPSSYYWVPKAVEKIYKPTSCFINR